MRKKLLLFLVLCSNYVWAQESYFCLNKNSFSNILTLNSVSVYSNGNYAFYAQNDINQSNSLKVKNGSNVTFIAGNSINLTDGFQVETGGIFLAQTEKCPSKKSLQINSLVDNFSVRIFPNPVKQQVFLSVKALKNPKLEIALYDLLGKEVLYETYTLTEETCEQVFEINTSQLKGGIYIIKAGSSGNYITSKIIRTE
jgi:hypothetical protein